MKDEHPYIEDYKELAKFLRVLADHLESPSSSPLINFMCFYHLNYKDGCAVEEVGFHFGNLDNSHLLDAIKSFSSDPERLEAFFKDNHANFLGPSEWFKQTHMKEKN